MHCVKNPFLLPVLALLPICSIGERVKKVPFAYVFCSTHTKPVLNFAAEANKQGLWGVVDKVWLGKSGARLSLWNKTPFEAHLLHRMVSWAQNTTLNSLKERQDPNKASSIMWGCILCFLALGLGCHSTKGTVNVIVIARHLQLT